MRRTYGIPGLLIVVMVLGACPSPSVRPVPDREGVSAPLYGDSVVDVTARLVTSVPLIDSAGRARGALPQHLEEVLPARWLRDIFGNVIEYSRAGPSFTLRSPGRDRIKDTDDDVFVTGRLGRSVPCELHRPGFVSLFQEQAPLCRDVPVIVLPGCPNAEFRPVPEFSARRARPEDHVRATGERLVFLAWRVDGRGRAIGALPPASSIPWLDFKDSWGRPVAYRVSGQSFELASAGADGIPDTGDDVLVKAELGASIPCLFTHGGQQRTCDIPPPGCR
jgi:hypothetical protein